MAMEGKHWIVVGVTLGLSLMSLVLGCAFAKNWWPLLILCIYALAPVPWVLAKLSSSNSAVDLYAQFGNCTAGFILSTLFGMPLVFFHTGQITETYHLLLWLLSNLLMLGTAVFVTIKSAQSDGF